MSWSICVIVILLRWCVLMYTFETIVYIDGKKKTKHDHMLVVANTLLARLVRLLG